MIASKAAHLHKFEHPATQTIMLYDHRKVEGQKIAPGIAGKDVIKLRVCKCGKSQAYDLERTIG